MFCVNLFTNKRRSCIKQIYFKQKYTMNSTLNLKQRKTISQILLR